MTNKNNNVSAIKMIHKIILIKLHFFDGAFTLTLHFFEDEFTKTQHF